MEIKKSVQLILLFRLHILLKESRHRITFRLNNLLILIYNLDNYENFSSFFSVVSVKIIPISFPS